MHEFRCPYTTYIGGSSKKGGEKPSKIIFENEIGKMGQKGA